MLLSDSKGRGEEVPTIAVAGSSFSGCCPKYRLLGGGGGGGARDCQSMLLLRDFVWSL